MAQHPPRLFEMPLESLRLHQKRIVPSWDQNAEKMAEPSKQNILQQGPAYVDQAMPCRWLDGYKVAVPHDTDERQNMIGCIVFDAETNDVVGGHVRGVDWVDPAHRGQGLGAEIARTVLEAPNTRGEIKRQSPGLFGYTTPNYYAHLRAHRKAVEDALTEGLEVPDEVLEAYPDLQPQHAQRMPN